MFICMLFPDISINNFLAYPLSFCMFYLNAAVCVFNGDLVKTYLFWPLNNYIYICVGVCVCTAMCLIPCATNLVSSIGKYSQRFSDRAVAVVRLFGTI